MNDNLKDVINFLKNEFKDGIQCFENGIIVDHCYYYDYIEVFGLTKEEFLELAKVIDNS